MFMSFVTLTAVAQNDSTLQSVQELQRVDVVAERQVSPLRASVPVQRIDRDRMLRLGLHTIPDALRHMAGITLRDYGGAGGMKTVSVRGIGARHTAVVYDGIALSDCQTGEIDLSRYSLDQLSTVALVIGDNDDIFQPARNQAAAATLYLETDNRPTSQSLPWREGSDNRPTPLPLPVREGSDYSQGVKGVQEVQEEMHITPLPHREGLGGGSSLSLGSFGLVNPSLRLSTPPYGGGDRGGASPSGGRARVGASLFADFFHADNDYPFTLHNVSLTTRERRTNSRMNSGRAELNFNWQPNIHNTLSAKAYYYNNHRRLPGIVHYYTNENHERLVDQNAFAQLRFRSQLSPQFALLANAKFNWAATDYQNRTPGSGLGDASYWQREAYGSASLLYEPNHWLSLDYAADLQYNSLNSTLTTFASHPHRTLLLQCLAAKAQWSRLTLVARALHNLSYDSSSLNPLNLEPRASALNTVEPRSSAALSPSLSLSYQLLPREQFFLRLMAKRIFRLPTFNELYFYHIGTADLKPEYATQFNLGLTWQASLPIGEGLGVRLPLPAGEGPGVGLSLDAYANRVSDKIVAVPFNMFVWRIMNIDRATILGADVVANASVPLGRRQLLSLNANYSWQRAMNSTVKASPTYHHQLPYTPEHTACATLTWENPWLSIAATLSAQSARWTTIEHAAGTRMPGFATTDLSLSLPLSLNLSRHSVLQPRRNSTSNAGFSTFLRFTVQNLFDRQYALVAHYPMPGRSFRMQLMFNF